ncbi:ricin B lectin domain-containing protein, partial [Flagelloscypha sp. PMI_526]
MALSSFFFAILACALPAALAGSPTTGMPINPNGDQSKCLGVVGGNMYNGAQVDIDSQKWFMGNGLTPVSTAFGNYCLDAGLPPFDNNRVLTIWECNKDLPQQQWYRSDDYGTVALNGQRKCMDLTNGSKDNRNLIQIYD